MFTRIGYPLVREGCTLSGPTEQRPWEVRIRHRRPSGDDDIALDDRESAGQCEDGVKSRRRGAISRQRQPISEGCNGPQAAGLLRVQRNVQLEHCATHTILVANGSANKIPYSNQNSFFSSPRAEIQLTSENGPRMKPPHWFLRGPLCSEYSRYNAQKRPTLLLKAELGA